MDARETKALDKRLYEALWARHLALDKLSAAEYEIWMEYRSVDKVYLALGESLVIWRIGASRPLTLHKLKLESVASFENVVSYTMRHGDQTLKITHTPQWVEALKIFLWIPHFNEMRNQPADWDVPEAPFQTSFGIALWQRTNPMKRLTQQHHYCTTEKHFLKHWATPSPNPGA